uniref:carbonic anhydrase n=1 Tax=Arion vulgaris TaxID=1028688 RepID=A0A0B7AW18_9EUPU
MAWFKQDCWRQITSTIALFLMVVMTGRQCEANTTAPSWNYQAGDVKGPENWYLNYPDCDGVMQSPINIVTNETVQDKTLQEFDLTDYTITDGVKMKMENVGGHTAEVVYAGKDVILKGGSLPAKYKLRQFHFHWGGNTSLGSEHSIDGRYSALEMHLVHTQIRFETVTDASCKPFGLAVLAVLIEVGRRNKNFDVIINNLSKIPKAYDEIEIDSFAVRDLLPSAPLKYYRYYGSLTTPPCCESVIWSVAVKKVQISADQLNAFRSLLDDEDKQLVDDYRFLQNLNSRTVLLTV